MRKMGMRHAIPYNSRLKTHAQLTHFGIGFQGLGLRV